MASSNVPPTLVRGTNNTGNATVSAGVTPSRLLLHTNSLRNDLLSRNLYTPNNIYPITEKAQAQQVINAIGGIASIIAPFKSYNLKNTVYGRLLGIPTPLTEIGLAMLGKQFAMNSGSHIAQQNFPVIKVANLFDGAKKTKLFTKNIDLKITKKEAQTGFQQFLDAVIYYYPARDYPFTKTPTNVDYIKNSGKGQLTFLYQAMNQNIYKEGFGTSLNDIALTQSSEDAGVTLTKRNVIIDAPLSNYKSYFNYFLSNPYSNILPSNNSINTANIAAINSLNYLPSASKTQEYAPSADFVEKNFGITNVKFGKEYGFQISSEANAWVNPADEFGDDNVGDKLVWGKNGIAAGANDRISSLRGNFTDTNKDITKSDLPNGQFRANSGLLEYTRNLLNASEGAVVDITRKAFLNKNKNVEGFNGSGLWVANNSTYAQFSNTALKTGVRQHSMLDQYDRFAKAIRFNGNIVYGGNENSVIYDRVLPRIHPTGPTDKISGIPNNKNLMFSIENLAVRVISKDGVGIIDDEYGSTIPICEVGQFNGRQMWFPPYNMEINETSNATFEKTTMVGRNEPMYNYMYTERGATLSFTLLIDYPQNLKNQLYQNVNKHRDIAEFFAFGGEPYSPEPIIINPPEKIETNTIHSEQITGPLIPSPPEVTLPTPALMVFPNDFPSTNTEASNGVNTMYLTYQYQIEPGSVSPKGYISDGLNENVYFVTGMTGTPPYFDPLLAPGLSQYTYSGEKSDLDKKLNELFKPVDNRILYGVKIIGHTTTLNDKVSGYNKALGLRRALCAKNLVVKRLAALFPGENLTEISITTESLASKGSNPANSEGKTQAEIDAKLEKPEAIRERYAEISFVKTGKSLPPKVPVMSYEDTIAVEQLSTDNQGLDKVEKKQNSNNASQCIMNDKKADAAMQKGFQSVEGNYYNPVFHSQTPEDFHRRLTFLQQCVRQGAAKRYDVVDDNGIPRAKNSVFGRQPICILRVGDFFFTKVIIENLTIDYSETTWDMNPEGFGMQPMIAKITLQMKVIGGQSLKGPIDALQNAVTFNYYANSNFTSAGMYNRPSTEADNQQTYIDGILTKQKDELSSEYDKRFPPKSK